MRRRTLTLIVAAGALALGVLVATGCWLAVIRPALRRAAELRRMSQTGENLRRIGEAMTQYVQEFDESPPSLVDFLELATQATTQPTTVPGSKAMAEQAGAEGGLLERPGDTPTSAPATSPAEEGQP